MASFPTRSEDVRGEGEEGRAGRAGDALKHMEEGAGMGKIVLDIPG